MASTMYCHGVKVRMCPHCAMAAPTRSPASTHDDGQAAVGQVGGGCQTDRAGADDDDGQLRTGLAGDLGAAPRTSWAVAVMRVSFDSAAGGHSARREHSTTLRRSSKQNFDDLGSIPSKFVEISS